MKTILLSLMFALTISGCATADDSQMPLFQTYAKYTALVDKDNVLTIAGSYFSPSLLGEDYKNNPGATSQLLFHQLMAEKVNHRELVIGQHGCLSINGYDEGKEPLTFSLAYIQLDDAWFIAQIHVVFLENESDFPDVATCPDAYSLDPV
ncbi:hypothetical protein QWY20_00650 [Alkalimonas sp. MEB108]|uniref:Nuclear transport factor 2 family protein n=1 Tax=Alkalimonas cellulosilytica TaxID=3058395 RepID=A0ABU7J0C3_9GAMM|nr:hypothetical protein [Alkalimonas sp. MEB108]MEE1999948.1 hypothetical protein [Alkalimonas sp. MEB108]